MATSPLMTPDANEFERRLKTANLIALVDVAIEQLRREQRIDPWLTKYVEQRIKWLRVEAEREGRRNAT